MEKEQKNGPPAEQEGLMSERPRQPKKSACANFLEFLYDPKTGKVLGRGGKSWLQITVFYIIFYSCLAGFFAICLAVFVQTLDPKVPRYYGKGTIIGINPGMGYQPWLRNDPESTLIHFNKSDESTYQKYVDQIELYLSKYNKIEGTRPCKDGESNKDKVDEACRMDLQEFYDAGCNKENAYGFKEGKPCILITLNRLIGWEPIPYPKDSAPSVVDDRYDYDAGNVAIDCEGEYYADNENMGDLKYIPKSGLAKKFFPYSVRDNYHQPLAMVKFMNLARGILVEVECKAYAYNIIHDRTDRQGMVHFEVLVD